MKRSILVNDKKTFSMVKSFEIITLVFLICTFTVFVFLINKKPTPVIENREELAQVFKNSDIHGFLGFEKNEQTEDKKSQLSQEYIKTNGRINIFGQIFNMEE